MPKYDFAGWVTKNDVLCTDGVTIRHGSFKGDNGKKVPLVWAHDASRPENILGHVILEHRDEGVYGRGFFNDTETGKTAKQLVEHGDIIAMSIKADARQRGMDVVDGAIKEVSLVMKGANSEARIEHVLSHEDDPEGLNEMVIYTNQIIHSADSVILNDYADEDEEEEPMENEEVNVEDEESNIEHADGKTIQDVIATLNPEQLEAVELLIGGVTQSLMYQDGDEAETTIQQGDDINMKQNIFQNNGNEDTLTSITHEDIQGALATAQENSTTFKTELAHLAKDYGIRNIEVLFPEATNTTRTPEFYKDHATGYKAILAATSKSPFQRVKMMVADLTETTARARGYITGDQKFDQVFEIFGRETTPQTIYKRQRLDRDDIIDVEDFSIVPWIQSEMREQLEEELARAILVGDGRNTYDRDKIKETNIRPIINDDKLFTIKQDITSDVAFFEDVIKGMVFYKGSGAPTMYIDPILLGRLKLLKGSDGRYLGYKPMTTAEMADLMGVKEIVPTTLMLGQGAVIVNLNDYRIGAARGGEVTNFDDFDIDFNQYIYLIETRLSGALVKPFSAIHFRETDSQSPDTVTPGLKSYFDDMNQLAVTVVPAKVTVEQGASTTFEASITGSTNDRVVWSVNSKDVVINNDTGVVSVKPEALPGDVTVTARVGTKVSTATLTVKAKV